MAEKLEKRPGGLLRSAQSEETYKTPDPRPHYVELDALRGIGILGIVMTHALLQWNVKFQKPLSVPLINVDLVSFFELLLGPSCLTLFFLLSGYLLTWTEGRRASKGNYSLRSYAFRRALRLVPAYYVALVLIFLLWPSSPTLTDTVTYLAVLQSFVPQFPKPYDIAYWYLTSEVVFYALLPLLILKLRGLYQRLALFGVLVVTSLTVEAYLHANIEAVSETTFWYLRMFPLTHLWIFVAGVLLRMLVERLDEKGSGGYRPTVAFSLLMGPLAFLALFASASSLRNLMESPMSTLITDSLAILFFAAALLGSPVLSRILSWRLLGFVGMISYSLYLLHGTVLVVAWYYVFPSVKAQLAQLDGAAVWIVYAGYAGSVLMVAGALSYLSYRYIESPFLRFKPK